MLLWLVDVVELVGDEVEVVEAAELLVPSESSWKKIVDKTRWKYDCGLRINIVFNLAGKYSFFFK